MVFSMTENWRWEKVGDTGSEIQYESLESMIFTVRVELSQYTKCVYLNTRHGKGKRKDSSIFI